MKKFWLIGLIVLTVGLWSNFCFAGDFKAGSEPDGFRGIKWGTDIKTLKGMKYWSGTIFSGEGKTYIRKNDDLHMGGAELERIEYSFLGGKFCNVSVFTRGYANWCGLKEVVFERFGKVNQGNEFPPEYYLWFGNITDMSLQYDELSEEGKFFMFSMEIAKQVIQQMK